MVIKRGGKKQNFSASKIKRAVARAAREAKLPSSEIKKLMGKVANPVIRRFRGRESVRTSAIRKAILSKLNRKAKAVSAAWKKHERRRKKRR